MSGRRNAWTPSEIADLEANWPLPISGATLAERVGRDISSCRHKAHLLGLPPRGRRSLPPGDPPDEVIQIIRQGYEDGASIKSIVSQIFELNGAEYNTAQTSSIAKQLGFKHRKQTGRVRPQQAGPLAVLVGPKVAEPTAPHSGCLWVTRPVTSPTGPVTYCGAPAEGHWCDMHRSQALQPTVTDL